jgi:Mor family transcriptional regulator
MSCARTSGHRIRVEELVALFGERMTTRLIRHCGGRRIPRYEQYLRVVRQRLVVYDWLNRGYSQRDLAAKYELSLPYVKRLVARQLRQRRRNATYDAD